MRSQLYKYHDIDFLVFLFLLYTQLSFHHRLSQNEQNQTFFPGFCDKIYNWINEIASFVPGDNGMPVYENGSAPKSTGSSVAAQSSPSVNGAKVLM